MVPNVYITVYFSDEILHDVEMTPPVEVHSTINHQSVMCSCLL